MHRTEFFRQQADRFSKLARESTDPQLRIKLRTIAEGYEDMLGRKATDADQEFDATEPVGHA
jgi:hypothetical protein